MQLKIGDAAMTLGEERVIRAVSYLSCNFVEGITSTVFLPLSDNHRI